jgi:hypothetical protein
MKQLSIYFIILLLFPPFLGYYYYLFDYRRFDSTIGPRRIPARRIYYTESSPPHAKRAESIEMPGIPFLNGLDDVGAKKA